MTLFLPGMEESFGSTAVVCSSTARSWCDPAKYEEIVGVDFGSRAVHYYMARAGKSGTISFLSFASWLASLPANTLVVCEWAHLAVPQTSKSLAQPYKANELLSLYESCKKRAVTLKLASHAHSGLRMRLWVANKHPELIADGKKSDLADAIALAVFVQKCNDISLANPPLSFDTSPARAFGREVTKRSNVVLNAERTAEYHGRFFPQLMKLAQLVKRRCGCNLKVAATIVSTLACENEGQLYLFTYRGQLPGRRLWMSFVLRMSPWHYRGGTGRSNLMWHAFKPYLARYGKRHGVNFKVGTNKYKQVALMSQQEKAVRTAALRSFREMLLLAKQVCIAKATEMGACRMELTDTTQEATDGTHS
jgi:hypothetical protein